MFTPKRLSTLFIFSVMMLFSASSMASIFSYITKSEEVGHKGDAADYTFIIQRWDPEPRTTPNPCYGWKSCYITINHRHEADGSGGSATKVLLKNAHLYPYMEDLRAAVVQQNGNFPMGPMVAEHRGVPLNRIQECVGLFYQRNDGGIAKEGYLLPGSICGIAPPPVGACQIIDGSVDISYGDIDENNLNNAYRAKNFNVTCNKDMTVMVYASALDGNNVKLRPDNSLYANLYLNNRPGESGTTIFVQKGRATSVEVSTILRTQGRVAPGPFSGVGTLVLSMP